MADKQATSRVQIEWQCDGTRAINIKCCIKWVGQYLHSGKGRIQLLHSVLYKNWCWISSYSLTKAWLSGIILHLPTYPLKNCSKVLTWEVCSKMYPTLLLRIWQFPYHFWLDQGDYYLTIWTIVNTWIYCQYRSKWLGLSSQVTAWDPRASPLDGFALLAYLKGGSHKYSSVVRKGINKRQMFAPSVNCKSDKIMSWEDPRKHERILNAKIPSSSITLALLLTTGPVAPLVI